MSCVRVGRLSPGRGAGGLPVVMAALLMLYSPAMSADWPAYKKDVRRSSVTDEKLASRMRAAWIYKCAQPPSPAWPEPVRIPNRMDFDYAPHPVIAGGLVYFASTADDTIRALDVETGRLKWRFTTAGPVRFAPQIADGKCYAAGDDGVVRCLDAATGETIWTFRAAPRDERLIGNRRMISRWPVRSGVLVSKGVVYCVAGIWPTEGIYVYALDADTGKVIWCNDTGGFVSKRIGGTWRSHDPHSGEFTMYGVTPQGALLASRNSLLVPMANNMPASYDRRTGRLLRFNGRSSGGTWATIDGNMFYNILKNKSEMYIFARAVVGVRAKAVKFGVEAVPQLSIRAHRKPYETHSKGKVSAIVRDGKLFARNAFGLALAGDTLLMGQDGFVAAVDAETGREIWRVKVNGEAREIAVAGGRVFVGTRRGEIYCFAPDSDRSGRPATVHDPAAKIAKLPPPADGAAADVLERVRSAGMDRGFALVLGDADGGVSVSLAAGTDLRVVNVLTDEPAAAALRERLLDTTTFYGSRIHVQTVRSVARMPFARYFANAIVVAGPVAGLSGKELYRLLRPCGGVLLGAGLAGRQGEALVEDTGAPAGEIRTNGGVRFVVRGRLEGARDWDSAGLPDRLVKWPLRPIWFGGPDSKLLVNFRIGQHPPVVSNGRYFVTGEDTLTAVDAYNGAVLWTRPIPTASPDIHKADGLRYPIADSPRVWTRELATVLRRALAADGNHVYLYLGAGSFRGAGEGCIQIDARTGRQKRIYAPFTAPPLVSLDRPRTWPLTIDEKHSGALTIEKSAEGLTLRLETKDPAVTRLDAWDIFLDFRPASSRYGLYDRGVFHLRIHPAADGRGPRWSAQTSYPCPTPTVSAKPRPGGTETTVRLPWGRIERIIGRRPTSFGFAAMLNSHDGGGDEPVARRYLFGDVMAASMNNGWANVVLRGAAEAGAARPTAVLAGSYEARPAQWPRPGAARAKSIDTSLRSAPRIHPLTGEPGPRVFRSGTGGCGRPVFSATGVFGRATHESMSIYDFADDSGVRFFGGIAANCGVGVKANNITAALGVLIFSEGRSHCDCMTPFRTNVVFAPTARRLNEDWAIFCDRDADAEVRQAAVNFGAFGDRRDDAGTLWLGFPRPAGGRVYPLAPATRIAMMAWPPMSGTIQVPLKIERFRVGGPYRANADRIGIAGAERQWIYASGYRGIKTAVVKLLPRGPLASRRQENPASIDGVLEEPAWAGEPTAVLPFTKTKVFFRHDAENLYVAASRPPVIDRRGKAAPWTRTTEGEDAAVWDDDSWELFLSDAEAHKVVHLGVAASGARYDALAPKGRPGDPRWNGKWAGAASADEKGLVVEMAIPWRTLTQAGLSRDGLAVNFRMNQRNISTEAPSYPGAAKRDPGRTEAIRESYMSLGAEGRGRCGNFAPLGLGATPPVRERAFTVRLLFAELGDVPAGRRVFDVKLQERLVLKGFDVVKAAGGPRKAVVKEFRHVKARETLRLEFIPAGNAVGPDTAPILSGMELFDEEFRSGPD